MNKVIFVALFVFIFGRISYSQNTFEFLRLDGSARAASLGGSFVSNNDDADVIFYNPAGIQLLEGNPASFSFVKHLMDINLASLSYSTEYEGIGRFGAAIKYINYGTFDGYDEFGASTKEFGVNEMALVIGYANVLDYNFYYGANIKFIYSGIEDRSSTGMAVDLGLHYSIPDKNWYFGFAVLNLGSQLSSYYSTKEDLPLDIVIGVSKSLENLPVRLSVDFHKLNQDRDDFVERFRAFTVGAEFTLSKVMKLRFGYDNERRKDFKIGTTAGIAGFNVGLGVRISDYQFDYAYSALGSVGGLHRIGISTSL
ncbi:MAG TPA: type IX secretion system protein PorQ [Ignavibacteriaceae bacterium]|nr:type IX secretion system protein PorQ [Ignavibacteriaceae bacterium]